MGSDPDLVVVVERATEPFERRRIRWDASELPVPADIWIYTPREWEALVAESRFGATVQQETLWVYERSDRP